MLDVVDLGTKKGAALVEFLKKGAMYFRLPKISRKNCLGIDRHSKYRRPVEKAGFQYHEIDILEGDALGNLPEANYYIAWHFLEHLPRKQDSNKVVAACLQKAKKGCWFRLPSFQQDNKTGEGVLREHGLRFTWTHWTGHPSHYLIEDCRRAIKSWAQDRSIGPVVVRPAGYIKTTGNKRVVPIDAPIDTVAYANSMGAKPHVVFNPPVVDAWEVLVTLQ